MLYFGDMVFDLLIFRRKKWRFFFLFIYYL